MLSKKIVTSAIMLLLVGLVIFCSPNWVFLLLTVFLTGLGLSEFFSIAEARGIFVYKHFGVIAGCIIPLSIYMHLGENYINLEPFFIVIACLFTFILQFIKRENSRDHLVSIAVTLLALFYISWFFSFFIKLKFLPRGEWLVTFLVLVTKSGDVGAYFAGRSIGKRKLIPRISPQKTVEGTIGGLATSVVVAFLSRGFLGINSIHAIFVGMFFGVLGQVGDLAESLVKRDCGVKDAGNHFSGFGGILDIIDSLLFTVPIFYFYVKLFL